VAIYVNRDNSLQLPHAITRECPQCGAHAQLLPVASPAYNELAAARPRHTGLLFRCAACSEPRFLRASVRAIDDTRAELSGSLSEVEKPRERFTLAHLPPDVEKLLREALECYSAGCYNAFASMCRRTLHATRTSLGRSATHYWRERFAEVVRIAELDTGSAGTLESVFFGEDDALPAITREHAGVLLEAIKDMLYQCYVRTARLRGAMRMRRYFAGDAERNITPLATAVRRARSA
jgi:hypothetical protein